MSATPQPSQASSLAAVAILSLALGYWIGVGRSLGVSRPSEGLGAQDESKAASAPVVNEEKASDSKASTQVEEDDDGESESESEDDDGPVAGLDSIKPSFMEECKMVNRFRVRT